MGDWALATANGKQCEQVEQRMGNRARGMRRWTGM